MALSDHRSRPGIANVYATTSAAPMPQSGAFRISLLLLCLGLPSVLALTRCVALFIFQSTQIRGPGTKCFGVTHRLLPQICQTGTLSSSLPCVRKYATRCAVIRLPLQAIVKRFELPRFPTHGQRASLPPLESTPAQEPLPSFWNCCQLSFTTSQLRHPQDTAILFSIATCQTMV